MKNIYLILTIFLVVNTLISAQASLQPSPHDLVFEELAESWDEGIPLGNGMMGALVWEKDGRIRIALDRADLWDLRPTGNIYEEGINFKWVKKNWQENTYKEVYDDFLHFENVNELPGETVFSIYPNPASEQVTIEYTGTEEPQMMLLNTCGQVVMEKKLRDGTNQVNTGHLSQGVYIMLIFNDNLLMGSHKLIRK